MRPSEILPQHRETIRQLVLEAGMANPRVFGSTLRGEDEEDSDLDILVDPAPRTTLLDLAGLQIEIEKPAGVKVDLLTPMCLPVKFRQKVLDEAQPVWAGIPSVSRITPAYEEVDLGIIWNLVELEVPALKPRIVAALKEFEG